MTEAEKKQLFRQLYKERFQKEGHGWKRRFARSLVVTDATVRNWLSIKGGWTSADQEEAIWAYFGYMLNERGDPVPQENKQEEQKRGNLDATALKEVLSLIEELLPKLKAVVDRGEQSEQGDKRI